LLISPEKLFEINLLSNDDLKIIDQLLFYDHYVNFNDIKLFKDNILKKDFRNFEKKEKNLDEKDWIDDFILFMTIKDKVTYYYRFKIDF
jgi:4-alpha-glucanotransferase